MNNTAVFPGSFDPITNGHINIIERGLKIFDRIVVGIGNNSAKNYMFPLSKRMNWIQSEFSDNPKIEVVSYEGLTVNFCKQMNAGFILRGLRTSADFEFERAIAQMNSAISEGVESIFILSDVKYSALSSSIVRDILKNGGNVDQFVPPSVKF